MGLTISVYSGLKRLDVVFDESGEPIDPITREDIDEDYVITHISSEFPDQADNLKDGGVYSYNRYENFHMGSYWYYDDWRESLAELAGYQGIEFVPHLGADPKLSYQIAAFDLEEGPFHELICFSDCFGVIGERTSEKLSKDFKAWDNIAKEFYQSHEKGEEFYGVYKKMTKFFEIAKNNGFVEFS